MSETQAESGGRSLSKSVIYGLLMGGGFLLSVLWIKELFIPLAAVAAAAGAWELATAIRTKGWYVPHIPVLIGGLAIMPATYFSGALGHGGRWQWVAALVTIAASIVWRLGHLYFEKRAGETITAKKVLRDIAAAAFVTIYLPLTCSFIVLLLSIKQDGMGNAIDGGYWVVTSITTVALIDTTGYLVGRKWGRTPFAPRVSPKKTWEGFAASVVVGGSAAVIFSVELLHRGWLFGLVLAAGLMVTSVIGDLSESLIKRDLGIKDMSSWLPGHGGVVDRLDSHLPSAILVYLLATLPIALPF